MLAERAERHIPKRIQSNFRGGTSTRMSRGKSSHPLFELLIRLGYRRATNIGVFDHDSCLSNRECQTFQLAQETLCGCDFRLWECAFSVLFLPVLSEKLQQQLPTLPFGEGLDRVSLTAFIFSEVIILPGRNEDSTHSAHRPVFLENLISFCQKSVEAQRLCGATYQRCRRSTATSSLEVVISLRFMDLAVRNTHSSISTISRLPTNSPRDGHPSQHLASSKTERHR